MQTRRSFFRTLAGVFTILPSAGRIWKATRPDGYLTWDDLLRIRGHFQPTFQDFLREHPTYEEYKANPAAYLGMSIKRFRDIDETEAYRKLYTELKRWPPNLGETTRLVHVQPIPLAKPNLPTGDAGQLYRPGLVLGRPHIS